MKDRCSNPNSENYKYYGGRGIRVCERWINSFKNYCDDVGDIPFENAQLDRTDNDGDYEPSNVRWVTPSQNAFNKGEYATPSNITKRAWS